MSNLCTSDLASVEMYIIYYLSKFGVNDSKDGKCIMLQKISTINSYCSFVIIITIILFINEHNCFLKHACFIKSIRYRRQYAGVTVQW